MHQNLRTLYLKIVGNAKNLHDVTLKLHYLDTMFPRSKLKPALETLIKTGCTGENFIEWFNTTCKRSNLEMHRELIKMVERDRELRRLTGKDLNS